MKTISATVLTLTLAASAAVAQEAAVRGPDEAGPAGRNVVRPAWVARPSPEVLGSLHPPVAAFMNVGGRVVLRCRVRTTGAVDTCQVQSEVPAGLGFGRAALGATTYFRMRPMSVDGVEVDGAQVDVPIIFNAAPKAALLALAPGPVDAERLALGRRLAIAAGMEAAYAQYFDAALKQLAEGLRPDAPAEEMSAESRIAIEAVREAVMQGRTKWLEFKAAQLADGASMEQLAQAVEFFESPTGRLMADKLRAATEADRLAQDEIYTSITDEAGSRFCAQVQCPPVRE